MDELRTIVASIPDGFLTAAKRRGAVSVERLTEFKEWLQD
jgi:hypothetical protein